MKIKAKMVEAIGLDTYSVKDQCNFYYILNSKFMEVKEGVVSENKTLASTFFNPLSKKSTQFYNISIERLKLCQRTENILKQNKIFTLGDLKDNGKTKVQSFHNLGKKSIKEIELSMIKIGGVDSKRHADW